jgi:AraC family transcriptional regulator of adaptative response/methylated-DNA-[protein]-cysteine methyltransferase
MGGNGCLRQAADYQRIEKTILFIEANFRSQPTLDQIAQSLHVSRYHFDRLFKRWAGISPIQFLQFITLEYTKKRLAESKTALEASLSGPSRLHDLFITFEAMTPGEYKKGGAGLKISYGFCDSPFGMCLLATSKRGICYLGFEVSGDRKKTRDQLCAAWPDSIFVEDSSAVCPIVNAIFENAHQKTSRPFNLQIKGTNFQINVWKALLNIPEGWVVSYQDIASHIGRPTAVRAVANAIAINPVSYLIPCHRVIANSGKIHRYRWGSPRKKALLAWEAARRA